MAACPVCHNAVGWRALLTANGFSGVICGRCHASLQPVVWRSVLVVLFSVGAAVGAVTWLRGLGVSRPLALAGMLAVQVAVWLVLTALLGRLRARRDTPTGLDLR